MRTCLRVNGGSASLVESSDPRLLVWARRRSPRVAHLVGHGFDHCRGTVQTSGDLRYILKVRARGKRGHRHKLRQRHRHRDRGPALPHDSGLGPPADDLKDSRPQSRARRTLRELPRVPNPPGTRPAGEYLRTPTSSKTRTLRPTVRCALSLQRWLDALRSCEGAVCRATEVQAR